MLPGPGGTTTIKLVSKPTSWANGKRPRLEEVVPTTSDVTAGSEKAFSSSSGAIKEKPQKHQRFSWPNSLQRDFVGAIFDVGLHHASPNSLLELMPPHRQVSQKTVQIHLHNYVRHRRMVKIARLPQYQVAFTDLNAKNDRKPVMHSNSNVSNRIGNMPNDTQKLAAASSAGNPKNPILPGDMKEVQQHTSSSNLTETNTEIAPSQKQTETSMALPQLTDEEKQSLSGESMGYLVGLFFSLNRELMAQRAAAEESGSVSTVEESGVLPAGRCSVSTASTDVPSTEATCASSETPPRQAGTLDDNAPNALVELTEPVDDVSVLAAAPASLPAASSCTGKVAASVDDTCVPLVTGGAATALPKTSDHLTAEAARQPAATAISNPSMGAKLQANSLMKREMESQMSFQLRIRALKLQELEKYKLEHPAVPHPSGTSGISPVLEPPPLPQGAGEAATFPMEYDTLSGDGPSRQIHGMPIGHNSMPVGEDLLSTIYYDNEDQQLFEFLMMGDQDGE